MKKRKKIITLLGVKKKNDILYENKFKKLGAKILVTSEDGSYGAKGLLTEHVADIIKKGRISAVYSCGPEKMMDTLGKICESLKVPCYLSVERFMKCGGLGLCGQCEINGVLVCQDGPVFDYQFLKKLPDFGCFKRDKSGAKTAI